MVRTLLAALLLLLGLGVGFIVFIETLPSEPSSDTRRSDAIVVLTGGASRVAEGLRLLADGLGDALLISGVHPDTELAALLALAPDVPASLASRITLDRAAANTVGNARETARWAQEHGVRSLRVVTAAYHMPRSLLELEQTLPGVELIPNPVFPPTVDQKHWWASSSSAGLLLGEYLKYLVALATSPFAKSPDETLDNSPDDRPANLPTEPQEAS